MTFLVVGVIVILVVQGSVAAIGLTGTGADRFVDPLDVRGELPRVTSLGIGRRWGCPVESAIVSPPLLVDLKGNTSSPDLNLTSMAPPDASHALLRAVLGTCGSTPGCASFYVEPLRGLPLPGCDDLGSVTLNVTMCRVRVVDPLANTSLVGTDQLSIDGSSLCTSTPPLLVQPWYVSLCGSGGDWPSGHTPCVWDPDGTPTRGYGIDGNRALAVVRGTSVEQSDGAETVYRTVCSVSPEDSPHVIDAASGKGGCSCTDREAPASEWPRHGSLCTTHDDVAGLPRSAASRPIATPPRLDDDPGDISAPSPPWSFPVIPASGVSPPDTVLTARSLVTALTMDHITDVTPLVRGGSTHDYIRVLVTPSGVLPGDITPGPSSGGWNASVQASSALDLVAELMPLCRDEPTFAASGGCKSWSIQATGEFNSRKALGPLWAIVNMYMSQWGDTDEGHEMDFSRILASTGTDALSRMDWEWTNGENVDAAHFLLHGTSLDWMRLPAKSAMTVQMCTAPSVGGSPAALCTVTDVTTADTSTDTTLSDDTNAWTIAGDASDVFTETPFARRFVTHCAGVAQASGSVPLGVTATTCGCASPGAPDACNGEASDFLVANPDAYRKRGAAHWESHPVVIDALETVSAEKQAPGRALLPSYGDVGVEWVAWGHRLAPGVSSPCVDPDSVDTPTIHHLVRVNNREARVMTSSHVTGTIPVASTADLLDIAVQACATEAWSTSSWGRGGWSCTGVAWGPAWTGASPPCDDPDTTPTDLEFDVYVCTGPGGLVPLNDSGTWLQTREVDPSDGGVWASCVPGSGQGPPLVSGVAAVCRECSCTSPYRTFDVTDDVTTQDCVSGLGDDQLSLYPGGLLTGSGSGVNSPWDVVWSSWTHDDADPSNGVARRQPTSIWWGVMMQISGGSPLFYDRWRLWNGILYDVYTVRVTSDVDRAGPGSGRFLMTSPSDIVWISAAVCARGNGANVTAVSWDPWTACGSGSDPEHVHDAMVRVTCDYGQQDVRWKTVIPSSDVDACPSRAGAGPLNGLRAGGLLTENMPVAVPRLERLRWSAFPGFAMTTSKNNEDDDGVGQSDCPSWTGSWTPVRAGAPTPCPDTFYDTSQTFGVPFAHGATARFGEGPFGATWFATSVWPGVQSDCRGTSNPGPSRTRYAQFSKLGPPESLAGVGIAGFFDSLADDCVENDNCAGVVVRASIQDEWNPLAPASDSLTVQWTSEMCVHATTDTALNIDDTWTPETQAYGLAAPSAWTAGGAGSRVDLRSVVPAFSGMLASFTFSVCLRDDVLASSTAAADPKDRACWATIPVMNTPRGVETGPADLPIYPWTPPRPGVTDAVDPRRIMTSCYRRDVWNSQVCECRGPYTDGGSGDYCNACSSPVYTGGVLADSETELAVAMSMSGVVVDANATLECVAFVENFCAPRGEFIAFPEVGDVDVPICNSSTCVSPWGGESCADCLGCTDTDEGLWELTTGSVCVDNATEFQSRVCDCSASPWFMKDDRPGAVSGPVDTRACTVCRDPRAFARPYVSMRYDHWGEGVFNWRTMPGWCWAVLAKDAYDVWVDAGYNETGADPVPYFTTHGSCHPTADVSASRYANTCVYPVTDDTPHCFDANTDGCVTWAGACNDPLLASFGFSTSVQDASIGAGRCECRPEYTRDPQDPASACNHCSDTAPFDYRSRPEIRRCLGWPDVCSAQSAVSYVWNASDPEPDTKSDNHPSSIVTGCLCLHNVSYVGDESGGPPWRLDCVQCDLGRVLWEQAGPEGYTQTFCPLEHPRKGDVSPCGSGWDLFRATLNTETEICECMPGWAHANASDPTSPCTVCDTGFEGPNCDPCPNPDGSCPPGAGSCVWDAVGNTTACECGDINRETWPHNGTDPPGCGGCVPHHFRDECSPCRVECGEGGYCSSGEADVDTDANVFGSCACHVGWKAVYPVMPWYERPCMRCNASTHTSVGDAGAALSMWGESYVPGERLPELCMPCPSDCVDTCSWSNELGTTTCPCTALGRSTHTRPYTADELETLWVAPGLVLGGLDPFVAPNHTWVCGGCLPERPFGPDCVACHSDCGGGDVGTCVWGDAQTECVCTQPGYVNAVPGDATSSCTVCAVGWVHGLDRDNGYASCQECPRDCPVGTECFFDTLHNITSCDCAAANRVTNTSTGSCGNCFPGFFMGDGGVCNVACPNPLDLPSFGCGVGGLCVLNAAGDGAECLCGASHVNTNASDTRSPCSTCAPDYIPNPDGSGECGHCRASCPMDAACVWGPSGPRCDCASIFFMEMAVLAGGHPWITCTSDYGCTVPTRVGPFCEACPPDGCGNGTCVWSSGSGGPVCECDVGWDHVDTEHASSPCSVCEPHMLEPRCTTCDTDCAVSHPGSECKYVPEPLDDVACVCTDPFVDPETPGWGSSCTACLHPDTNVGPGCVACPPDCGRFGSCQWTGSDAECVCPPRYRNADRSNASTPCVPCDIPNETPVGCVPCDPLCADARGMECYDAPTGGAACRCKAGFALLDTHVPGFTDCYSPEDTKFIQTYVVASQSSSTSETPSPSPSPVHAVLITPFLSTTTGLVVLYGGCAFVGAGVSGILAYIWFHNNRHRKRRRDPERDV